MDFACAKALICVRNGIHVTSKYTLLRAYMTLFASELNLW